MYVFLKNSPQSVPPLPFSTVMSQHFQTKTEFPEKQVKKLRQDGWGWEMLICFVKGQYVPFHVSIPFYQFLEARALCRE